MEWETRGQCDGETVGDGPYDKEDGGRHRLIEKKLESQSVSVGDWG